MKRKTVSARVEALDPRLLLSATPVRVKEFHLGTDGSYPHQYTDVAGTVFFVASDNDNASDPANHQDLWKTDGTAAGTVRVKDFGGPDAYVQLRNLTAVGGRLFFTAPGDGSDELWMSDGTEAGTRRVKDIMPGPDGSFPGDLVDFNGTLFFAAEAPGTGRELWKSDGTEAGTVLVRDIDPAGSSSPSGFTEFNGKLYFNASDAEHGQEMWVTDGTGGGTVLVADLTPGPDSTPIQEFAAAGGKLFFITGPGRNELWRSDGTAAGTQRLRGDFSGGTAARPFGLTDYNGTLVFVAGDARGWGVWKSDGTAEGTTLLKPVAPGTDPSGPNPFVRLNDTLYFSADGDLWKTDGTEAGTVKAVDLVPGPDSGGVRSLTLFKGALYFSANSAGAAGPDTELWKSDGTPAGTTRVADIIPGPGSSSPGALYASGDRLFFSARGPGDGYEPWVTDGTAAGTVKLADINTTPVVATPRNLVDVNGRLFFTVGRDDDFQQLWASDGTEAGTRRVSDVLVGSYPFPVNVGGTLYFVGFDPAGGWEVWKTDGTDAGTARVKDAVPGPNAAGPLNLFNYNGTLLFVPAAGGVWKSDGTEAGTVPLADAVTPTSRFVVSRGITYFGGRDVVNPDPTGRSDFWRTDGTPAGTFRVDGIPAPYELEDVSGTLYFSASGTDFEVWKTDGTAAGSARVKDVFPGPRGSLPSDLTAFGDRLLFYAQGDFTNVRRLYRSDGTEAGTVAVGPNAQSSGKPAVVGDSAYFSAFDNGYGLWKTDGSASVKVRPFDLPPGQLTNVDGTLYFTGGTTATGTELWKSDGTAAGTALVGDLAPGRESSSPSDLTVVGGRTLFFSTAGALWKVDPAAPAAVVGRHVFYNHSRYDGNDAGANAADDGATAADKLALLPGGVATFANVTSYDKGINGVMVDIAGLPQGATLTPDDFDIGAGGSRPLAVSVRRGAGAGGSDRVTLTWPDYNPLTDPVTMAVGNGWLRVTVKANAHTGLAASDVFSFGNLIGEAGDATGAAGWRVSAADLTSVRRAMNSPAPLTRAEDFNRDGRVNALDLSIARRALNQTLPPPPPSAAARATTHGVAEELGLKGDPAA